MLKLDFFRGFQMMLRQPYWCMKTIKWGTFWCTKSILWLVYSFLAKTLSFATSCLPWEQKHFNTPKTQCCMPERGWIPAFSIEGEGLLERATPLPCLTPEGLGSPCSTINLVSKPSFLLYKLVCICVTLLTTGMFIWRDRYMDRLIRTKAVSFTSPHPQRISINGWVGSGNDEFRKNGGRRWISSGKEK